MEKYFYEGLINIMCDFFARYIAVTDYTYLEDELKEWNAEVLNNYLYGALTEGEYYNLMYAHTRFGMLYKQVAKNDYILKGKK